MTMWRWWWWWRGWRWRWRWQCGNDGEDEHIVWSACLERRRRLYKNRTLGLITSSTMFSSINPMSNVSQCELSNMQTNIMFFLYHFPSKHLQIFPWIILICMYNYINYIICVFSILFPVYSFQLALELRRRNWRTAPFFRRCPWKRPSTARERPRPSGSRSSLVKSWDPYSEAVYWGWFNHRYRDLTIIRRGFMVI
jgi:hypothetical protein